MIPRGEEREESGFPRRQNHPAADIVSGKLLTNPPRFPPSYGCLRPGLADKQYYVPGQSPGAECPIWPPPTIPAACRASPTVEFLGFTETLQPCPPSTWAGIRRARPGPEPLLRLWSPG